MTSRIQSRERSGLYTSRAALAAVCCAGMLLYAAYFGALGLLLPPIGALFCLGPAEQGRLFPAAFLGFTAGVLACGPISDRFGRKPILLISLLLYAIGLMAFAVAPHYALVLAAAAAIGAGTGAMMTVGSALCSELYPRQRAVVLGLMQVSYGMGSVVGPIGAQFYLARAGGYPAFVSGLAAAVGALVLILATLGMPADTAVSEPFSFAALFRVIRRGDFIAIFLAHAIYVGTETGYLSWTPTYYGKMLPGGAVWAPVAISCYWMAITAGRMVVTALVTRFTPMRINIGLASSACALTVIFLFCRTPVVAFACMVISGFAFSGIAGMNLSEAANRFHRNAGSALGGIVAAGGLGGAMLPWAVGLASAPFGWHGAFVLIPLAMASVAFLSLWLIRHPDV